MKKNDGKKKKDIFSLIRAKQENEAINESAKLREFLENLPPDTCDEDYRETDLYKLGWEDSEIATYEIASQKFQDELRGLRTMIDALIDSK